MIAGQHDHRIVEADLPVDRLEQPAEGRIGLDCHRVLLGRVRAVAVSHVVVRREADGQYIRHVPRAQLLGRKRPLGELLHQFVAHRAGFERRVKGIELLGQLVIQPRETAILGGRLRAVEVLNPSRQVGEIVCAAHEVAAFRVEPVGAVRHVAGGQNGGAVLERNADYPRFAAVRHLQFVPHRADHQPVRGRALPGASQQFRLAVADAGDVLVLPEIEPVVADNAAHRRGGPCQERAVSDRRDGRKVDVPCVGENRAPGQQPVETGVVFGAEPREVVVAELVHHDRHHQFGLFRGGGDQGGRQGKQQQKLLHGI